MSATVAQLLDRLLAVHSSIPQSSRKPRRKTKSTRQIWRDASRKYRRKDLAAWRQRNARHQKAWRERQKAKQ